MMDYLERVAPAAGFVFDTVSLADLSVAVSLENLRWARALPASSRWPKTLGWWERTRAIPALAKVTRLGDVLMQTAPGEHRDALASLGVALTNTTVGSNRPRRSIMIA